RVDRSTSASSSSAARPRWRHHSFNWSTTGRSSAPSPMSRSTEVIGRATPSARRDRFRSNSQTLGISSVMRNVTRVLLTAAAVAAGSACTVKHTVEPSVTGPSEVALSVRMSATPDRVVQDGAQASRIAVAAFNSAGQAVAVSVHLATFVNNFPQSFGTLSAQDIVTGTDANNPVVVTYVPPASTSGSDVIVTIVASAVGRDGAN